MTTELAAPGPNAASSLSFWQDRMARTRQRFTWPTRRSLLRAAGFLPFFAASRSQAEGQSAFPLHGDDGGPLQNLRAPAELDPAGVPGIIWKGPRAADVILYEFFDYNCGFCRKASGEIEDVLAADRSLRIGFVNNAILSLGSAQAAKVQQSVLRLYGPEKAYVFHLRMFGARGPANGAAALAIVRAMGLDARKVEESADSDIIAGVLTRQAKLAAGLGMEVTPSFVLAGVAIQGWPGPKTLRAMIANARKCDQPVCGSR